MTLENDQFQVTITEAPCYTVGSADNKPYDVVWNPIGMKRIDFYMDKALAIEVCQGEESYRGILLVQTLSLFNQDTVQDWVLLTGDRLTVLGFQRLIQLDLVSREVLFCRELSAFGDTMAIYPCPEGIDGYVIWGECEIIKLNAEFEQEWTESGPDIFVSMTGESAFQMTQERIILNDFLDNHLELDFQGHTLAFRPGRSLQEERERVTGEKWTFPKKN